MASVIIKTVERCNINCTYCYFFNKIDQSYKIHPPYIKKETILDISKFLAQGCKDLNISQLKVVLHGGEPLLQKKINFDYLCTHIKEVVQTNETEVLFALQTNAMLVDEEWIQLFNKHKISVCVSIDGPKEYHDKYRIDKKGNGTFDRTLQKIKLLNNPNNSFGVCILCVMNPTFSASKLFDFFKRDLNISQFDFLLPDAHHDDKPTYNHEKYADFYCDIFKRVVEEGIENVNIRFIRHIVGSLLEKDVLDAERDSLIPPITISSNGELSPVDDLRNTNPEFMLTGCNISNTTYKEFLSSSIFKKLQEAASHVPKACNECCWYSACKGGHIIHRYSKENMFNNESVYCGSLKKIYGYVASHLINEGIPFSTLADNLNLNE